MQIFDTHAHIGLLYSDPLAQLRAIQEAKRASVTRILSICNSLHDFYTVYENLKAERAVYHAIGVSPSEVLAPGKNWADQIEKGLQLPGVVAVGETGLDYYKKYGDQRSQIELFITQLDIAAKAKKPVIIHNRNAGHDILNILAERIPAAGGIMHCYSEDAEFARLALDLPLYFSFAGNLTYRNARNLHETVLVLPLDRILVESESPFMPPAPHRKERNMPANTVATVEFMADLLDMDTEELAAQLWKNSCAAFQLSE
ncbi:MAG: TatD family hydrolase [Treponema sp.]